MLQDRVWSAFCHGRANFEFILVSWFRRCSVSALPKLSTRNKSSPRCSPSDSFIRCEISCFRMEFGMHFVTGEQISNSFWFPGFNSAAFQHPQNCPPDTNPLLAAVPVLVLFGVKFDASGSNLESIWSRVGKCWFVLGAVYVCASPLEPLDQLDQLDH